MSKRVVIIEDNALNLKLFSDILEAHEYEVVDTGDGAEAIALIAANDPDLVIMDIQLPNISGVDLIEELKADDTLKMIPVIAVTAFAMKEDRDKIMAAGCEDYVAKPINIDSFMETIHKYAA